MPCGFAVVVVVAYDDRQPPRRSGAERRGEERRGEESRGEKRVPARHAHSWRLERRGHREETLRRDCTLYARQVLDCPLPSAHDVKCANCGWPAGAQTTPQAKAGRKCNHRQEKTLPVNTPCAEYRQRGECFWRVGNARSQPNDSQRARRRGSFERDGEILDARCR